jgi:pantoate--beta-alanine ligase
LLPHEDFDTYPRTLDADCQQLEAAGCDLVFAPLEAEMYPQPQTFKVHPTRRVGRHSGRPLPPRLLHWRVHRGAEAAVLHPGPHGLFGKKDYQQLMVIRNMVKQFAMPVDIVGGETQRAEDGLALSSATAT